MLVEADGCDCYFFSILVQRHWLHILHIEALELVLTDIDDVDIIFLHYRNKEVDGAAILSDCSNRTDIVWLPDLDVTRLIRCNSG